MIHNDVLALNIAYRSDRPICQPTRVLRGIRFHSLHEDRLKESRLLGLHLTGNSHAFRPVAPTRQFSAARSLLAQTIRLIRSIRERRDVASFALDTATLVVVKFTPRSLNRPFITASRYLGSFSTRRDHRRHSRTRKSRAH